MAISIRRIPIWRASARSFDSAGDSGLDWIFAVSIGREHQPGNRFITHFCAAAGAVLLVRIFSVMVGPKAAIAVTLLSVGGVVYASHQYLEWLRLIDLPSTFSYNPELHLAQKYAGHLGYNRFFSPGTTLPLLLIGLLPLLRDADLRQRKSLLIFGALLGLQLYVYPHAILFLGLVGLAAIGISALGDWRRQGETLQTVRKTLRRIGLVAVPSVVVGIPFLVEYKNFHHWHISKDVIARIGLSDEFANSAGPIVFAWLAVGIALKWIVDRSNKGSADRFGRWPIGFGWCW